MRAAYFVIYILLILVSAGFGDIFRLKNGEIIEGDLITRNEKEYVIKVKYGTIKVDSREIVTHPNTFTGVGVKFDKPIILIQNPIPDFTNRGHLQGLYRWLKNQVHSKTGLLESFRPTSDVYLEKQAATYDEALAGLSFLILGDKKTAQAIIDFYNRNWNGNGFSNFYFTPTGNPGIEGIAHLGPNLWIALLALHYDRLAGKDEYEGLAVNIVKWAMSLPHYRGGAAMSNRDEWRAPWTKVVSTENNIDYYSVLDILEKRVKDPKLRAKIEQEKFGVVDFLIKTVYDRKSGGMYRGFHNGGVDREYALDTVSWLIAAAGVEKLREWRVDVEKLLLFAERRFLVKDSGIKGFDFTDKRGAFKANRARLISIEWTLAMVNVYFTYRNYYSRLVNEQRGLGNIKKARRLFWKMNIYEHKAHFFLKEMDKKLLKSGPEESLYSYPYATRSYWLVFYDSPWWKTPKASASGVPAGSVASTTWRIFAGRFNPLSNNGRLE